MITLDGELIIRNEFDGELTTQNEFDGELNITVGANGIKEYYDGEYTVIPKVEAQILDTEEKYLKKNILVNEIPKFETSNASGGTTVYIGSEV